MDEDVHIDPDRAVLLGLILSELATNAVKHGFTPQERGFRIGLCRVEEQYRLRIENTGRRFPPGYDITRSESLGLVIVQNLVSQLHGTLSFEREPNTAFEIAFPRSR
jgi:two-component sensor histidine kinase